MVKLEEQEASLRSLPQSSAEPLWFVEVPPIRPDWRQISLQKVKAIAQAKKAERQAAKTSATRWKQLKLCFDKHGTGHSGQTRSSAAQNDSSASGRPFKRSRIDQNSQDTSNTTTTPETVPRGKGHKVRRLSPVRPLNPFRPSFSTPFAEASYPADAEASIAVEPSVQSHFGQQVWSPASRVAPSSEGYKCCWMMKPKLLFDPGQSCDRAFISAERLLKHVIKAHLKADSNTHACKWDTCKNRSYHGISAMQEHLVKHLASQGWSCPFQLCRLSSSKPINQATHDQHVDKAHDQLFEKLRPLALPRRVKDTLEAAGPPPPLPTQCLLSWQLSIPVPRASKTKNIRLAPWQIQPPSLAAGGLVGVASRNDVHANGAAPWSSILPILDHLEPCSEPLRVKWPPRDQVHGWSVDLSEDDPALARERWHPVDDEEEEQEAEEAQATDVSEEEDCGQDEDAGSEAKEREQPVARLESPAFEMAQVAETLPTVEDGQDIARPRTLSPAAPSLSTNDTLSAPSTWTPPNPFPPRRRPAAATTTSSSPASLSPNAANVRDASTQTEAVPVLHTASFDDNPTMTPPPTYYEATSSPAPSTSHAKRIERAVQMTASFPQS